jgi:hypothetical protein
MQAMTMTQHLATSRLPSQIGAFLLAAFAVLGMALAAIGVYGTVRYTVAMRTREVGIRMALGADAAGVARLLASRGVRLVLVGGADRRGRVAARGTPSRDAALRRRDVRSCRLDRLRRSCSASRRGWLPICPRGAPAARPARGAARRLIPPDPPHVLGSARWATVPSGARMPRNPDSSSARMTPR